MISREDHRPRTACRWLQGLAVALLLAISTSHAGEAIGEPVAFADGDTFYMLIDGERRRIRLADIDAPESRQAFGRRAEQSLRDLIGRRTVTVRWKKEDRYGRLVAWVSLGQLDVNAEQVRRGFAWVDPRYNRRPELVELQARARADRAGLWADPHAIEPWIWRASNARRTNDETEAASVSGPMQR